MSQNHQETHREEQQPPSSEGTSSSRPGDADKPDGHNRITVLAACLFVLVVTLAVFGQTLSYDFVNYDDNTYVWENLRVMRGLTARGIAWAFTSNYASNWHPLTWLSHMLDCQLYGLWPGGHHLTNVILHAATAVLLLLVLLRMTGALWPSAFVAVVFAVHPLRVESVAWVAERKDVLSGLFFVLTIGAYARYAERPSPGRYSLVALAFVLGLMAKPMLVTLPFVLLLLDYWPLRRCDPFGVRERNKAEGEATGGSLSISRLVLEKFPLFGLVAVSCAVTVWAQQAAMMPAEALPVASRAANVPVAYVGYLGQMFYPVGLAVLYPHRGVDLPMGEVGGTLVLLLGISAAILMWTRKHPYLIVGWLWYLGTLVPVIGLVQVGSQALADRYTYLSQIGLYILIAWAVAELSCGWRYRRLVCGMAAAAVIAALLVCTWRQTLHWRNSETLWTRALACTSGSAVAHSNFALVLHGQGKYVEAIEHYRKALTIDPRYHRAHGNWANSLVELGKLEEAIEHYKEAVAIDPEYASHHNNWGTVLSRLRKFEEAIDRYRKALAIDPEYASAHCNWGNALSILGEFEEAIEHYSAALAIDPRQAPVHNNWGNVLLKLGKPNQAVEHFRALLAIDPQNADAHYNWGNALRQLGALNDAIEHYREALAIDPRLATAHGDLGNVLLQLGKPDEAIEHYKEALVIDPHQARVHSNWGNALMTLGKAEEAITRYRKALDIDPGFVTAHANLGNTLMQLGKPKEAIEHFKQALAIDPGRAGIHVNSADALLKLGRPGRAIEHCKKAITIDSRNALAHRNWGMALLKLRKPSEAVEHLKRAVAIDPRDTRAQYRWGNALLTLGKPDQAIEHYKKVLEINPRFALAHNNWGNALLQLGKPDQAIGHFETAMEIDPTGLEAPNNLAWLLATCPQDDVRDAKRAVELAERACEAGNYRISGTLDTLAAAYAEAGRFPDAVATLTKALDLLTPQQESAAEDMRGRLMLYQAGKPYREQPQGEHPNAGPG